MEKFIERKKEYRELCEREKKEEMVKRGRIS